MATTERKLARGQHRDDLDASALKFGELFDPAFHPPGAVRTLSMSEAAIVLQQSQERRRMLAGLGGPHAHTNGGTNGHTANGSIVGGIANLRNSGLPMSEAMRKTVDYMDAFVRHKSVEACEAAHDVLARSEGLHDFEVAQLKTLCPEDAEEAKTLVPSLIPKISDDVLQGLLDGVNQMRNF